MISFLKLILLSLLLVIKAFFLLYKCQKWRITALLVTSDISIMKSIWKVSRNGLEWKKLISRNNLTDIFSQMDMEFLLWLKVDYVILDVLLVIHLLLCQTLSVIKFLLKLSSGKKKILVNTEIKFTSSQNILMRKLLVYILNLLVAN